MQARVTRGSGWSTDLREACGFVPQLRNSLHDRARLAVGRRVEHALSRPKNWKILRDCRLRGNGVHQAMFGIARLHNLALTG